eukprot:comp17086_c0_seq1/m.15836 comp17086_c0_seq1/g.15836  ORF comp17086_c0_seq1/g.15836 comp17086_c0_seq1/m.15836 type:complete len:332 (+) comp17086_c0_seq1:207-1202(+)
MHGLCTSAPSAHSTTRTLKGLSLVPALDQLAHELLHVLGAHVCNLKHLLVVGIGCVLVHLDHVCNEGQAQDLHAAVVGHNDLGHSAHAHGITPPRGKHLALRNSLVRGPRQKHVHTLCNKFAHPELLSQVHGKVDVGVGTAHGQEAGPIALLVGPSQGVEASHARHVDVVVNHHDVPRLEPPVKTTGGVCDEQLLDAHHVHDTHRQGDLVQVVALVEVEPALHHHDLLALQLTEHKPALVPRNCAAGEARDFLIRQMLHVGECVGKQAQARPGNNQHLGPVGGLALDNLGKLLDLLVGEQRLGQGRLGNISSVHHFRYKLEKRNWQAGLLC